MEFDKEDIRSVYQHFSDPEMDVKYWSNEEYFVALNALLKGKNPYDLIQELIETSIAKDRLIQVLDQKINKLYKKIEEQELTIKKDNKQFSLPYLEDNLNRLKTQIDTKFTNPYIANKPNTLQGWSDYINSKSK